MRSWFGALALTVFFGFGAEAQEVVDCNTIADLDGLQPLPVTTSETDCRLWSGGAADTKIYYPAVWGADPGAGPATVLAAIRDAIADSRAAYARLGFIASFPPIHAAVMPGIYTDETPGAITDAIMDAADRPPRHCDILAFEPRIRPTTIDELKQLIAHEVFHCVQAVSFPQRYTPAAYWWQEGSAEMASGLVYPAANREHGWTSDYHQTQILFDHKYPTALFFQAYANAQGLPALIALLRRMPDSDDPSIQYTLLSVMDGFGGAFHRFGQAYMDQSVTDPGGGAMAQPAPRVRSTDVISDTTDITLSTTSFIIDAFRLQFEGGRTFRVSDLAPTGTELKISYRYEDEPGVWHDVEPGSGDLMLETECDTPKTMLVLMTATLASPDIIDKEISVAVEALECETCACMGPVPACAVGSWHMRDLGQWDPYWTRMREMTRGSISYRGERGSIDVEIARNGEFSNTFVLGGKGTMTRTDRTTTVDTQMSGLGVGSVCRVAEDRLCWTYGLSDILHQSAIYMDGALVSTETGSLPPNRVTTSRYQCRGSRLMLESVYPLDPPLAIEFEYSR